MRRAHELSRRNPVDDAEDRGTGPEDGVDLFAERREVALRALRHLDADRRVERFQSERERGVLRPRSRLIARRKPDVDSERARGRGAQLAGRVVLVELGLALAEADSPGTVTAEIYRA